MRAADLAEAVKATDRIRELDDLARRGLREPGVQKLTVNPASGGYSSDVRISRRLFAIVEREWRADLATERAEHVRRLAQLGVTL